MADLDSDASSTASDAMLIVRSATSGSRADLERFKLAYSRKILLQLSHSPKIRPPQGLKPLTEWYGEYEMPSLHLGNAATNASGNGRYSARDGQPGRRERGERNGQQNERHVSERERPSAAATPATGQMGDFKLAGQRPFTMPKDNDSGDALSGANRRRQGLRDLEGRDNRGDSLAKEKDVDGKERPWGPPGSTADRRRQLGGEFIKKDGRAAEEGGWRSSRETTKDRQIRERGDRPAYGERNDLRVGSSNSTGDRRRQPAWMDEEKEPTPSSKSGQYSSTQRRAPNGTFSNDATPAWLSDGPDGTGLEDSLEAPSTAKQGSEASHVDSIQAFKAQMKDMERRKKIQDQKELRKEMGLPELPDEEYNKDTSKPATKEVQAAQAAPVKSVFADFLLPAKEKEANKTEERPRSSRFAKMFAGDAPPAQVNERSSPAAAHATNQAQSSETHATNSLLAALLPSAATSPSVQPGRSTSSATPPATQADTQSMARLMEMLHMSSAAPPTSTSPANVGFAQPAVSPANAPQQAVRNQARPSQQLPSNDSRVSRGQIGPSIEPPRHQAQSNNAGAPQGFTNQHIPPRHQAQQSISQQSPLPSGEQFGTSSPQQSRLANRSSQYNAKPTGDGIAQGLASNRPEALHAPVPPQANVNLLQLLAGQVSPPPGNLPPHMHNLPPLPPSGQQQQQQRQRANLPLQSPPPLGPGGYQNNSDQQQAHMAALLQAQLGAGRPPMPPQQPSGQTQYTGRQGSQSALQPPQLPNGASLRSPSGQMPPLSWMEQQTQPQPQHFAPPQHQPQQQRQQQPAFSPPPFMQGGAPNQQLPPHSHPNFAQQNALAHLLAQSGRASQQAGAAPPFGMPPPPHMGGGHLNQHGNPQGYQQQMLPPPPMHFNQTSPPPGMQQNQIDLMALLTGGGGYNGGR